MFPQFEFLSEVAALPTVRFAETPFPLLLVAHQASGSSGLLVARRGPIEKRVVLERGVPVECRSNLAHETFSRFLAASGRLTDEEANAALSRSVARGVLLGEVLVGEGRMDATELHRLLQQSLARKLFDLFTWRDGEGSFESGDFTTGAALKVKVSRLVLTGIERFVPQETIDAAIAPYAGTLLARHPEAAAKADELRPSEGERALLAALDPPRRIEELLALATVPLAELRRQIWGLALLGLVVPAERLTELTRRPELPEIIVPAFAEAAPPSPEDSARIRQRVANAFAQMRQQDAFELLAAADATTVDEIRACYFAFAREFAPWHFETPDVASAAPAAEELFAAGAIAFARLSDAKEREALRNARRKRAEPQPPPPESAPLPPPQPAPMPAGIPAGMPPDSAPFPEAPAAPLPAAEIAPRRGAASFRIETDLLDPELQFKKGRALKEGQRWSQALQQFDFAADCDPQNGAYRAEAAHCRFLLAPNTMGAKALDELREAQRIDPEAITPYLYAGEVAAHLGRFDDAETFLRSAAKRLGPEDRRALDALRDLAKKRKK